MLLWSRLTMQTSQGHAELEDKTHQVNSVPMLDELSYTIDRISSDDDVRQYISILMLWYIGINLKNQLKFFGLHFFLQTAYKALGRTDAHATTILLLNMLTSYSWDAKLVLTLAPIALNYGKFWLLAQIYSTNQLAKSMAILRQLPSIMEQSGPLKPRFDAIDNLIKVMMDVARCVVEFKDLPPAYISNEVPAWSTAMAHIPTAVYWTMRSVVACAAQITSLTTMGHEYAFLVHHL